MKTLTILCTSWLMWGCLLPACLAANEENKNKGDTDISAVQADKAPGTVSAMGMLSIGADQTTFVQNPRDLTVALKVLDGKNSFGLSVAPARTSLLPLSVRTYNNSSLARVWAGTTFSLAQGSSDVSGAKYVRRAIAVETSYFFSPHDDDPLVRYWDALEEAKVTDINDQCNLIPPTQPSENGTDKPTEDKELTKVVAKRAEACRTRVEKEARWNASRAWASFGTGEIQPDDDSGKERSLGRTLVIGATWGFGDAKAKVASALTVAFMRTNGAPVLKTLKESALVRKDSSLLVLRGAVGSEKIRALFEGSNASESDPTTATRVFKRAAGLEVQVAEGVWLNVRGGSQRRIDGSGDEHATSFNISYSPSPSLKL